MNFDHAFIITYGRSGSTLLQGVMNAIPDAEIRGENGNVLFYIHMIEHGLQFARQFSQTATDPTNPWYGADRIEYERFQTNLIERFKADILPPREGHSLIGFKEIRYHQFSYPQINGFIKFLRANFARTAVIFNTRDLDAVILSNQRAQHQVNEAQIRNADENFRRFAAENPEFSYLVHYDDYAGKPEQLRGLFNFLGAEFDAAAVQAVMEKTHSVRTS